MECIATKMVLSSTTSKGRTSSSPLTSAHEQPHTSASPFRTGCLSRAYASIEDNMSIQATSKEKPSSSEKRTPNRVITNAVPDKQAGKGNLGVKPTDLRSMLIFLLTENPRGMISLLYLHVNVKPQIATYQPPGRYILKSAEPESLQKPASQNGRLDRMNQLLGNVKVADGVDFGAARVKAQAQHGVMTAETWTYRWINP